MEARARERWVRDNKPQVKKQVLDSDDNTRCIIIGTLYKNMTLKPNILDEHFARAVRHIHRLLACPHPRV